MPPRISAALGAESENLAFIKIIIKYDNNGGAALPDDPRDPVAVCEISSVKQISIVVSILELHFSGSRPELSAEIRVRQLLYYPRKVRGMSAVEQVLLRISALNSGLQPGSATKRAVRK